MAPWAEERASPNMFQPAPYRMLSDTIGYYQILSDISHTIAYYRILSDNSSAALLVC